MSHVLEGFTLSHMHHYVCAQTDCPLKPHQGLASACAKMAGGKFMTSRKYLHLRALTIELEHLLLTSEPPPKNDP